MSFVATHSSFFSVKMLLEKAASQSTLIGLEISQKCCKTSSVQTFDFSTRMIMNLSDLFFLTRNKRNSLRNSPDYPRSFRETFYPHLFGLPSLPMLI